MTYPAETARYGYQVPHLVFAGFAGGTAALVIGGALFARAAGSPPRTVGAAGCVALGLALLVSTAGLRRLVVHGRPRMTEQMIRGVPWTGDERVLDVGCGPGLTLVAVAKRLTTGKVVGLDKWMVVHGERRNSKAVTLENARIEGVLDRIEVQDGDASAMPFEDEAFDVVVSGFVFHHMPRDVRLRAIREVVRVTKPGGRIAITDDGSTIELATTLGDLGMVEIENRRLTFPIRLLTARKAGQPELRE